MWKFQSQCKNPDFCRILIKLNYRNIRSYFNHQKYNGPLRNLRLSYSFNISRETKLFYNFTNAITTVGPQKLPCIQSPALLCGVIAFLLFKILLQNLLLGGHSHTNIFHLSDGCPLYSKCWGIKSQIKYILKKVYNFFSFLMKKIRNTFKTRTLGKRNKNQMEVQSTIWNMSGIGIKKWTLF